MGDEKSVKIKQFDGTGFNTWRYRMQSYLEELELEHCIVKDADKEDFWKILETDSTAVKAEKEAKKKLRRKQDRKCKNVIIGAIADDYLEYTQDKKSPKEIWDGLRDVFVRKSLVNRFQLKMQLLGLRYDERTKLESHFLRFDQLVRELKSVGAKLDDEDVICHLMLTMPTSFESVNTAMETVSERLTLEYVKGKYLDVDCKRKGTSSNDLEVQDSAFAGKVRSRLRCYKCGKLGHKKLDCPEAESQGDLQQDKRSREQKCVAAISFVASTGGDEEDQRWYLDSGTSDHMAKDVRMFEALEKLKKPVVISTAMRGEKLVAKQKGTVNVIAEVDGRKLDIHIREVLYVPDLAMNLLSLQRLEKSGKQVKFGKGVVTVEDKDGVLATGKRVGGLYAMDFVGEIPGVAIVTKQQELCLGNEFAVGKPAVEKQIEEPDEIQGGFDEEGERVELSRSMNEDGLQVVELCSEQCTSNVIPENEANVGKCRPREESVFVEKLKFRRSPGRMKQKKKDRMDLRGSLAPAILDWNDGPIERRLKRDLNKSRSFAVSHCRVTGLYRNWLDCSDCPIEAEC